MRTKTQPLTAEQKMAKLQKENRDLRKRALDAEGMVRRKDEYILKLQGENSEQRQQLRTATSQSEEARKKIDELEARKNNLIERLDNEQTFSRRMSNTFTEVIVALAQKNVQKT